MSTESNQSIRPTAEFSYRPPRTLPPTGPRKLPLLRIVLLAILLFWGYTHRNTISSGIPQKVSALMDVWKHWNAADSSELPEGATRKERMALAGGKLFVLYNGSLQESWRIQDSVRLTTVLNEYRDPLLNSLIRTLVGYAVKPGVLDLVFHDTLQGRLPRMARWRDSSGIRSVLRLPADSLWSHWLYFDAQTHCVWQSSCPVDPLAGGAVAIDANFDFAGKEHLMTHDMFRGIGEAPVVAVLPGRVLQIQSDSVHGASVELVHAGNEESVVSGLAALAEGLKVGTWVAQGEPLGRLSARDTAEVLFQMKRNGRFVRWEEYCRESRPLSEDLFATFAKGLFK